MPGMFGTAIFFFIVALAIISLTAWLLPGEQPPPPSGLRRVIYRLTFGLVNLGPELGNYGRGTAPSHHQPRTWGLAAAGFSLSLAALLTLFSSISMVGTRSVGILKNFGRPEAVHQAGPWLHAPWKRVDELSEAYQTQAFESTTYDDAEHGKKSVDSDTGPAVQVRLGNNSVAYVVENLQYRIKPGAALRLYQDYGGKDVFSTIQNAIVDQQAKAVLSQVFMGFNPQDTEKKNVGIPIVPGMPPIETVSLKQPDLKAMSADVANGLQHNVGTDVEIQYVNITRILYAPATQKVIDGFNDRVQDTKNAVQEANTAIARAQGSKTLSETAKDPWLVIYQCELAQQAKDRDPGRCLPIGGSPLLQLPAAPPQ